MEVEQRLGMALAFGRSLLAFHAGRDPRLLSATYAVTNRCNLRCDYCNTPFLDPTDLPLEKVATLFQRLARVGVKRLGLTGGEPLVRKDIGDIVAMAKGHGFYVTMNTNLGLYDRCGDRARLVDMFFTSLDGDRARHEASRGEGSYDGVLAAIESIVAGGRPVTAICVVTEHNLDAAALLLDVAERMGFRIHFQPQCTDTDIVRGGLGPALSNQRLRAFWGELLTLKRRGRPVASSVPYLRALAAWDDFFRTAVLDPGTRCAASRGFLYIDPQGQAYPCAYTKGKAAPIDFLGDDWRSAIGVDTPCTRCSVGPYLEFNLLYQQPVRTALSVLSSYG